MQTFKWSERCSGKVFGEEVEHEVGGVRGDEEVKFAEMNQSSTLPQKSLLPYIHFGRFYSLFSEHRMENFPEKGLRKQKLTMML